MAWALQRVTSLEDTDMKTRSPYDTLTAAVADTPATVAPFVGV